MGRDIENLRYNVFRGSKTSPAQGVDSGRDDIRPRPSPGTDGRPHLDRDGGPNSGGKGLSPLHTPSLLHDTPGMDIRSRGSFHPGPFSLK